MLWPLWRGPQLGLVLLPLWVVPVPAGSLEAVPVGAGALASLAVAPVSAGALTCMTASDQTSLKPVPSTAAKVKSLGNSKGIAGKIATNHETKTRQNNQSGRKIIRLNNNDTIKDDTKSKEKIQRESKPVKSQLSQVRNKR